MRSKGKAVIIISFVGLLLTALARKEVWALCDDPACAFSSWSTCMRNDDPFNSTAYCLTTPMNYYTRLATKVSCSVPTCTTDCSWVYYGTWSIPCGTCCFGMSGGGTSGSHILQGRVWDRSLDPDQAIYGPSRGYVVTEGSHTAGWQLNMGGAPGYVFNDGYAGGSEIMVTLTGVIAPLTCTEWIHYDENGVVLRRGDGCVANITIADHNNDYENRLHFYLDAIPPCRPGYTDPVCEVGSTWGSLGADWADIVDLYQVTFKEDGSTIATFETSATSVFYLDSLTPGSTYTGTITAFNNCGEDTVDSFICKPPLECNEGCDVIDDRCGLNGEGDSLTCTTIAGLGDVCRNSSCSSVNDDFGCICPAAMSWNISTVVDCPSGTVLRPNYVGIVDWFKKENLDTGAFVEYPLWLLYSWPDYPATSYRWAGESYTYTIYNGGTDPYGYNTFHSLALLADDCTSLVPNPTANPVGYDDYFTTEVASVANPVACMGGLVNAYSFYSQNDMSKNVPPSGATYTLHYSALGDWCCAFTAPDSTLLTPLGVIDDFSTDFTWQVNDLGENCGQGLHPTGKYWLYLTSTSSWNLADKTVTNPANDTDPMGWNSDALVDTLLITDGVGLDTMSGMIYSFVPTVLHNTLFPEGTPMYWVLVTTSGCQDADCYAVDPQFFIVQSGGQNWFQTRFGDVYAEGGILNYVPELGGACGTEYFSSEGSMGSGPGFISTPASIDLGGQDPDDVISSQGWWTSNDNQNLTDYYNFAYFYEKFDSPEVNLNDSFFGDDNIDTYVPDVPGGSAVLYRGTNDLEIRDLNLPRDKSVILLVDGSVTITGNIVLAESADGSEVGFLGVFASGDITLDETVGSIEGVFVTDGTFDTCLQTTCIEADPASSVVPLDAQGIFVTGPSGFSLERVISDDCTPAEVFSYRPEYILFAPTDSWYLPQTWVEKAP